MLTEDDIFNHYCPGFYYHTDHWVAIFHAPPNTAQVQLIGQFNEWDQHPLALTSLPSGKFWYLQMRPEAFLRAPQAGDHYQFRIQLNGSDLWLNKHDPAARQIESTHLAAHAIVTDNQYLWHDNNWRRPGFEYYAIYQLHPSRFSNRYPFKPLATVTEEVKWYIRNLGVTALQLLPINAFAQDNSWGYNGTFLYAIETSYGSPNELKTLVDTCHQNGIAVILDVVFNHSGNDDNILWDIDRDEYFSGDTDWGPMFHYGSDVTRHFLIQNLIYLATEYHIDGFRFDMSHILHKGHQWVNHVKFPGAVNGWNFIKELRYKLKALDPNILLIAEELPDNWYVTQDYVDSTWADDHHGPFDAQWCDAFHDNCKAVIRGDHLNLLYQALTYFGDSWHSAVNYTESHDEVGNVDGRIAKVARQGRGWNMSQIAACLTLFSRGIPMLFMGQEGGEWTQFGQNGTPPDGGNWWDHRLNLTAYEHDPIQSKILAWYRALLHIRKNHLWEFSAHAIHIHHLHNDNGVVAFSRGNNQYIIVLNFKGETFFHYRIGIGGFYKEIANTSWPVFNLFNTQEATRGGDYHHVIDDIHIPAFGAVVLERY